MMIDVIATIMRNSHATFYCFYFSILATRKTTTNKSIKPSEELNSVGL